MLVLINLPCYALFILVQRFFRRVVVVASSSSSRRRRRRVVVGVVGSGRAVLDGFFKSSVKSGEINNW